MVHCWSPNLAINPSTLTRRAAYFHVRLEFSTQLFEFVGIPIGYGEGPTYYGEPVLVRQFGKLLKGEPYFPRGFGKIGTP
jgi:hypothetical protein